MENKHNRFKRVASKRVTNILNHVRLLKNCANTNNYDFTEDDVIKMFSEIQKALRECRTAYDESLEGNEKQNFKF